MNYLAEEYYNDKYNIYNMKYKNDYIEDDYEDNDIYSNMNYEDEYDMFPVERNRSNKERRNILISKVVQIQYTSQIFV